METPEALRKRLFRKTKSQLVDEIASLRGLVATDVTERKQAEEALRESEARFRQLFEQAPIAITQEDWSGVKAAIDDLRRKGVTDIRGYLQCHPDEAATIVDRGLDREFRRFLRNVG